MIAKLLAVVKKGLFSRVIVDEIAICFIKIVMTKIFLNLILKSNCILFCIIISGSIYSVSNTLYRLLPIGKQNYSNGICPDIAQIGQWFLGTTLILSVTLLSSPFSF